MTALAPMEFEEFTASRTSTTEFVRFVGERLWLDFVNSDRSVRQVPAPADALDGFDVYVNWLHAARVLDTRRQNDCLGKKPLSLGEKTLRAR